MNTKATSGSVRLGPVVGRANTALFVTTAVLGFLTWFAIASGTWLTLFALDNLLKLPSSLRFPLSIGGLVLTVWVFWTHVIGSLRSRRTNDQVALMLEKKYGIKENVLINAIEFEGMNYGERQKDFVQETAKAASLGWSNVPLRELWQFGRMTAWGLVFAVLLALCALYALRLPRYADNAFYRYLHSLSDVPPAGSISLRLTPDRNVTIAEHDNLEITLEIGRLTEGSKLTSYPELRYKEGVGTVGAQRDDGMQATMEPVVGKPNFYRYVFENVRHGFAFRVFARDTYTPSVQVTVTPAPSIAESRFTITPPAYTAQEPREEAGPPQSVKCLPGSRLGIEVTLDKTAAELRWLWPGGTADFKNMGGLTWKTDVAIGDAAGAYDVDVKQAGLDRTVRVATGSILLKTDRKPEVRFLDTPMSCVVLPGDRLPLRIEAQDDYGLGKLEITSRPAYGGSRPEPVREWEFGEAPGERGKIDKRLELTIDASVFVPGRKYFLEGRASDFCPDTDWGISEPILLTVKLVEDLKSSDADLNKVYEALDRAIALQKEALDGTRNLLGNLDGVWLDLNREPRPPEDVQTLLDRYRSTILGRQLGVREALLQGVQAAPDKEQRVASRMKEIADVEAVTANDRSFDSLRRPFGAAELEPAVQGALARRQNTRLTRFDTQEGRYLGLAVSATSTTRGWRDETWIANLSFLGEDGQRLDSSGWKVLSTRGGDNAKEALAGGWIARGPLPYFIALDLGAERRITGIACADHKEQQVPEEFALYLSSAKPPEMVIGAPDRERVVGEMESLREVQETIYNQLLALKGREAAEIVKREAEETQKALGEEGLEQVPTVQDKLEDFKDKLREWTRDHEENMEERKALMDKPPQDFTDGDRKKLAELNLHKLQQARKLEDWVDDLSDSGIMDFGDSDQVKLSETIQMSKELSDMANYAAKTSAPGEYTWNMDTLMAQKASEITSQGPQTTASGDEPGSGESREDLGQPPVIPELPSEMPLTIPELREALKGMEPMIEQAGMSMMNTTDPSGVPMGDIYSSMAAAGKMGDTTPDPNKKAAGRSNLGRSGQADGQMVANEAPPVNDDEVTMPNRMSNTPMESGSVDDQGGQSPTSVGLSKPGQKPTDFAMAGQLPPEALRNMREFAGQMRQLRENIRSMMLALDRHNLPTTDLKKALQRLDQIDLAMQGGEGVGIRRMFNAALGYVDDAGKAVASAIELRRKEQEEYGRQRRIDYGAAAEAIPDGYEEIVQSYFKRLAEESASGR